MVKRNVESLNKCESAEIIDKSLDNKIIHMNILQSTPYVKKQQSFVIQMKTLTQRV